MDHYDPELAPDPTEWLQLDEGERIALVEDYHREARIPLPKRARRLHATIHTIVENQLTLNEEPSVRALGRLMKEGLSRHDAVHAIGSVVIEHVHDLINLKDTPEAIKTRCDDAIERLTSEKWLSGDT